MTWKENLSALRRWARSHKSRCCFFLDIRFPQPAPLLPHLFLLRRQGLAQQREESGTPDEEGKENGKEASSCSRSTSPPCQFFSRDEEKDPDEGEGGLLRTLRILSQTSATQGFLKWGGFLIVDEGVTIPGNSRGVTQKTAHLESTVKTAAANTRAQVKEASKIASTTRLYMCTYYALDIPPFFPSLAPDTHICARSCWYS